MGYNHYFVYLEHGEEGNTVESMSDEKTDAQQDPIVCEVGKRFLLLSLFGIDSECYWDHQSYNDHELITEQTDDC